MKEFKGVGPVLGYENVVSEAAQNLPVQFSDGRIIINTQQSWSYHGGRTCRSFFSGQKDAREIPCNQHEHYQSKNQIQAVILCISAYKTGYVLLTFRQYMHNCKNLRSERRTKSPAPGVKNL